ncbi:MAG: queuosine precursor transporter [Anaerolineae bacterium]|nr:queuosine precursor transporter [Anaerolineae bacterium]
MNETRETTLAGESISAAVILIGGYIAIQMISDIAATKAIVLGPLTMDGGIIYSLTFTWRDLIHKRLGIQAARATILLAAVINVVMTLYLWLVVQLPPTADYAAIGGQEAWAFIFGLEGMLPRIVFASIVAEVLAELTDTEVYRLWVTRRTRALPQWMRVLVSNAVSIPLDSALFVVIAFAGVLSAQELTNMFASNIVTKGVLSLASVWLIYLVRERAVSSAREPLA